MLSIIRDQQVLHEIDLHAMAFPDGYGGKQIQEPVQNVC